LECDVRLGQFGLKVQAAQSWQPDVEDQAAGNVRKLALQHFGRRTEHLNRKPPIEKIGERLRMEASSSITKTIAPWRSQVHAFWHAPSRRILLMQGQTN